ncbi:AcrR family transcriptional regulator [Rhodanobacter sp. ANJX3]|uniref:TetR/AcrR family transcriptional regulator n=1 Tax=unclassified Rhodanobacter TaxID=2621553 RepID=UPI0015CC90C6|nr:MULTISPECIES: TetR family transcriptional regulator [unclassified Rhodanobacter]MBB5358388.1 AcrR family transcriptional regulator [Rhodanobacter sp. ANJX3]NYE27870.1 AcrR family transcriptional regulator [Rhodanobacter sp. K2T2]
MKKTAEPQAAGRPYGGVAHEDRAAERRQALIQAATQVFGTFGFRKATVRAICQQARLNDRYFYAAFDSTDHLLRATYEHHAQRLHAALQQAIESQGERLEERIDAGLRAFFAFLRDTCAARVLMLEVMGINAETDATYQRNLSEFAKQIIASADPTTQNALGDHADQRIVGMALVGAMTNAGTAWLLSGYRDSEEKMVRNCSQVLLGTYAYAIKQARNSRSNRAALNHAAVKNTSRVRR